MQKTNQKRKQASLLYLFLSLPVFILISGSSSAAVIKSHAALTIDASTGEILFSKNSDSRLPPASTTKLMTAIVAIENENLSKLVTISRKASHAKPSRTGFKEGDQVAIEGLLYAALLESANDAAIAIAEAIAGSESRFVPLMNEKALSIGARDTKFINATGLPGNGQYTTALDLSKILSYALRFPKLRKIMGSPVAIITTEAGKVFYLRSTDKLLWSDEKIIGGKTGFTFQAGHCFVCAAQAESKTILVAILGSPSRKRLWTDTEKLISTNLQGRPPIRYSFLSYFVRFLLYKGSSFFAPSSPEQSPPYPRWQFSPSPMPESGS
jgi:D-alanyl-D-alanine carboxypeptidase (penicillin-binding protein 5/6)